MLLKRVYACLKVIILEKDAYVFSIYGSFSLVEITKQRVVKMKTVYTHD